jgi:DnaJ-class molecular chaperone
MLNAGFTNHFSTRLDLIGTESSRAETRKCEDCQGDGFIPSIFFYGEYEPCTACEGTGVVKADL